MTSHLNNENRAKILGGEVACPREGLSFSMTDLGRSSLRLILESVGLEKRVLLPDFLCHSITDVLKDLGVAFDFYAIDEGMQIPPESIQRFHGYDVVYLIDYFGQRDRVLQEQDFNGQIVIEDASFFAEVTPPARIRHWISFNSFRKIFPVADGSLIKSTLPLKPDNMEPQEAPFVKLRYEAKEIKQAYLTQGSYREEDYLKLFDQSNDMILGQKKIYQPSARSLRGIFNSFRQLEDEQRIREGNFKVVSEILGEALLNKAPGHFSFAVVGLERRDEIRAALFKEKIFLPVHWPRPAGADNELYRRVLSIPLDSRYTAADMERVAHLIKRNMR